MMEMAVAAAAQVLGSERPASRLRDRAAARASGWPSLWSVQTVVTPGGRAAVSSRSRALRTRRPRAGACTRADRRAPTADGRGGGARRPRERCASGVGSRSTAPSYYAMLAAAGSISAPASAVSRGSGVETGRRWRRSGSRRAARRSRRVSRAPGADGCLPADPGRRLAGGATRTLTCWSARTGSRCRRRGPRPLRASATRSSGRATRDPAWSWATSGSSTRRAERSPRSRACTCAGPGPSRWRAPRGRPGDWIYRVAWQPAAPRAPAPRRSCVARPRSRPLSSLRWIRSRPAEGLAIYDSAPARPRPAELPVRPAGFRRARVDAAQWAIGWRRQALAAALRDRAEAPSSPGGPARILGRGGSAAAPRERLDRRDRAPAPGRRGRRARDRRAPSRRRPGDHGHDGLRPGARLGAARADRSAPAAVRARGAREHRAPLHRHAGGTDVQCPGSPCRRRRDRPQPRAPAGSGSSRSAPEPAAPRTRSWPRCPTASAEYVFTDVSPAFTTRAAERLGARPPDLPPARHRARSGDPGDGGRALRRRGRGQRDARHPRPAPDPGPREEPPGAGRAVDPARGHGPHRWVDLTFGLTDGWWRFSDHDLRPEHALLEADHWIAVLEACGFEEARRIPAAGGGRALAGQAVLVARVPRPSPRHLPTRLAAAGGSRRGRAAGSLRSSSSGPRRR